MLDNGRGPSMVPFGPRGFGGGGPAFAFLITAVIVLFEAADLFEVDLFDLEAMYC